MIKNMTPITLAELRDMLKNTETEKAHQVLDYIKKFVKINKEQSLELKDSLRKLEIMALDESDIAKLIDFTPTDAEDVRKVFVSKETSLSQDEIEKILETLKSK